MPIMNPHRYEPNQTKPKLAKKQYFTHTIEKNLAIAIARKGGYINATDAIELLHTDPVSADGALKLLIKNGNAAWVDGRIKLNEDLFLMLKDEV